MKVYKETISDNVDIFFQVSKDEITVINPQDGNKANQHQAVLEKNDFVDSKEYDFAPDMEVNDVTEKAIKNLGKNSKKVLENASQIIFDIAGNFKQQSKDKSNTPDEIEVEFSLLIGADAKIVVVSGKAEAALKVRMKWNKENKNNG